MQGYLIGGSHEQQSVDILVIGGGINGAGVANLAAQAGLSIALCEQGDFASARSSNFR